MVKKKLGGDGLQVGEVMTVGMTGVEITGEPNGTYIMLVLNIK
jgi:hypothetical protein